MKDNETRAWRDWKMTCYTVLVVALLVTVVHLVVGGVGVKYRIGGLVTCGLHKQTSDISCISSNVSAQAQPPIDPAVM